MPLDLGRLGYASGAWDMTEAALVTLQAWLPYAVQQANLSGYTGKLVPPKTWGRIPTDVVEMSADQVPACYIATPGTTGQPIRSAANQSWETWYTLNVLLVDRDESWEQTVERASIWAALIRSVILSNVSLRGKASDTKFLSETFGPIPDDQGRTYAGTVVAFQVLMPNVTVAGDIGPLTPLPVYPDPVTGLPNSIGPALVVTDVEEVFASGPLP